jgi:hypothetical protein
MKGLLAAGMAMVLGGGGAVQAEELWVTYKPDNPPHTVGIFNSGYNHVNTLTDPDANYGHYVAGVVQGPDGLVYVAYQNVSANAGHIIRYNMDGTFNSQFSNTNLTFGVDMDFGPNGDLYITDELSFHVKRYDGATGQTKGVGQALGNGNAVVTGTGQYPFGIAVAPDGKIYVTNALNRVINIYDSTTGASLGDINVGDGVYSGYIHDIDYVNGKLYFSGSSGANIFRMNPDGTNPEVFITSAGGAESKPAGIAYDASIDRWAVLWSNNSAVAIYDGNGALVAYASGSPPTNAGAPQYPAWVGEVTPVPEPASLALLSLGGLAMVRRRGPRARA